MVTETTDLRRLKSRSNSSKPPTVKKNHPTNLEEFVEFAPKVDPIVSDNNNKVSSTCIF